MRLNKLVKKARAEAGVSQEWLAKKLGYKSAQFISNFEREQCGLPLSRVPKLVKALPIQPSALRKVLLADYGDRVAKALK